jgi:hypothetical protein
MQGALELPSHSGSRGSMGTSPCSTETSTPPVVPRCHQPKQRIRVFPEFSSPAGMKIVPEKELQTGCNRWAQVYEGQLTIGTQSCHVVVKLYQECTFPDLWACCRMGGNVPGVVPLVRTLARNVELFYED